MDEPMDFVGQQRAERYYQVIIILFAILGYIVGYLVDDFHVTGYIIILGILVAMFIVGPSWSMFREDPVKWLDKVYKDTSNDDQDSSQDSSGVSSGKGKAGKNK